MVTANDRNEQTSFRDAVQQLAAGVVVITLGQGETRTGLVANSVSSLSVSPPVLLISCKSSPAVKSSLQEGARFGVNILCSHHELVADRFAEVSYESAKTKYEEAHWSQSVTGSPLLADALAAFDCEVEEAIERRSQIIVLAAVRAFRARSDTSALVQWRGRYEQLGWSAGEAASAVGLCERR